MALRSDYNTLSARNNQIEVTVNYRGDVRDLGVFDTWEGGNVTAENTKHRRGGMGPQVAIGGAVTIEDVTISRDFDIARDLQNAGPGGVDVHWMSDAVGRAQVTAKKYYMDQDGVVYGRPTVITGILIGFNQPPSDSDSGDVAMFEIVINPNGTVG